MRVRQTMSSDLSAEGSWLRIGLRAGMMPWHWTTVSYAHCFRAAASVRQPRLDLRCCHQWPVKALPDNIRLGARDNPLLVAALNKMAARGSQLRNATGG